jgi:hypothetical protein
VSAGGVQRACADCRVVAVLSILPASRMQTTPDRCVFWEIPCWLAAWGGSRLMLADRPRLAAGCRNGPLGSRLKAPLRSCLDSWLGVDHSRLCRPLSRSRAPLTRHHYYEISGTHSTVALAKHASLPSPILYASRTFTVPTPIPLHSPSSSNRAAPLCCCSCSTPVPAQSLLSIPHPGSTPTSRRAPYASRFIWSNTYDHPSLPFLPPYF